MSRFGRLLIAVLYFLTLFLLWLIAELDPAILTILACVGALFAIADLANQWSRRP